MDDRDKIYSISVVVTGRCNLNCSYCHFFRTRSRKDVAYDISDEQFMTYMKFIRAWSSSTQSPTSYRFSGGEPMILGDRLFSLANKALEIVGTPPYILTAGKNLDEDWISKARDSAISHIFVSMENPIRPDKGSVDPILLAQKIKTYNSESLPIIPGVCVVPNDCFSRLYEICCWFYNELGRIPLICEINYGSYVSPSEDEWKHLEENLCRVVEDFFPKTHLNLFSSVIPEYAYGGIDPYLFELDLDNFHEIRDDNIAEKIPEIKSYVEASSYPKLSCNQDYCPWISFCKNTKWYWQRDENLSKLEDANHPNTTNEIS